MLGGTRRGKVLGLVVAAYLVFTAVVAPIASAQSITGVAFDKQVYDRDDVVEMAVSLSSAPARIAIEVYAPNGSLVWIHEDVAESTHATYRFKLPGTLDGTYRVYVAVEGSAPAEYTFTVQRPLFQITSVNPSSASVKPGGTVQLSVGVENTGASGKFEIRVKDSSGAIVAEVGPYTLGYNEAGTYTVEFTAPSSTGSYSYTVEVWNTKYSVVDHEREVLVNVVQPTTTTTTAAPPPPPPPPPPVETTPTTTTTTPINVTTTTTQPNATTTPAPEEVPATTTAPLTPEIEVAYVANISNYVSDEGVVVKSVKIVVPEVKVEILIPSQTVIKTATGEPVKPSAVQVAVLKKPPQGAETQKPVGPAIDIRLGPSPVKLSKPIIVAVPFNPGSVPPGYTVKLAYFNETMRMWVPLPTLKVDTVTGRVIGLTDHLTVFAAVAFKTIVPVTTTTPTATETITTTTTTTTPTTTATTVTTTEIVVTTTTTVIKKETETITTTIPVTITRTFEKTITVTSPVTVTQPVEETVTVTATKTVVQTTEKTTTVTSTSVATETTTVTTTVTKTSPLSYISIIIAAIAVAAAVWMARKTKPAAKG